MATKIAYLYDRVGGWRIAEIDYQRRLERFSIQFWPTSDEATEALKCGNLQWGEWHQSPKRRWATRRSPAHLTQPHTSNFAQATPLPLWRKILMLTAYFAIIAFGAWVTYGWLEHGGGKRIGLAGVLPLTYGLYLLWTDFLSRDGEVP